LSDPPPRLKANPTRLPAPEAQLMAGRWQAGCCNCLETGRNELWHNAFTTLNPLGGLNLEL